MDNICLALAFAEKQKYVPCKIFLLHPGFHPSLLGDSSSRELGSDVMDEGAFSGRASHYPSLGDRLIGPLPQLSKCSAEP